MIPLDHYRKLEAESHRASAWSTSSDLAHPDECPKLVIQGAAFAIPSRSTQIVPICSEQGVTARIESQDKWAVADELIRDAPIREVKHCPECGQSIEAVIEIVEGAVAQMEWLGRVMSLIWELLDVYYALDDQQKKALLSFPQGGVPEWLGQILDWCQGALSKGALDG